MEKINIFKKATGELTQDAFIDWYIHWANPEYINVNKDLHLSAEDFLKKIISFQHSTTKLKIEKVETWRQWRKMDLIVHVNERYVVIIENKTNSLEHSNQLQKYKNIIDNDEYYLNKNFYKIFVYLKTGNESINRLQQIKKNGYNIFDREEFLKILNKGEKIQSEIFQDFREYLNEIEKHTNSFNYYKNLTTNWRAAEGFFIFLQNHLNNGDWNYVANQRGGFLCYWYHIVKTKHGRMYIQIENTLSNDIKVVMKINEWNPNLKTLFEIQKKLELITSKHGLSLLKPNRFRLGASSTIASIGNAFPIAKDGKIQMKRVLENLQILERVLTEFSKFER